jgi:hypothetical protein
MATIKGINGALKAITSGGTPAVINELKGWSVEETVDTVEDTVMGDTSKTFQTTLKGWTATCELNLDPANAVQVDLLIGEYVDVEFYPNGASASTKFAGTGWVSSHSRSGAMADMVGSSVSIQGTGALTVSA